MSFSFGEVLVHLEIAMENQFLSCFILGRVAAPTKKPSEETFGQMEVPLEHHSLMSI